MKPPEKVIILGLCPLTNGSCSLSKIIVKDLEGKKPYCFLIFPSKHKDLVEIVEKILNENAIGLITAIAKPFLVENIVKSVVLLNLAIFA